MITQNQYAHFFYNVDGLGSRGIYKILERGVNLEDLFGMEEKQLFALIKECTGKNRIAEEIIKVRKTWNFEEQKKNLDKEEIKFVSVYSDEFPEKLKNIPDPPFGLYVRGALPNPKIPCVSIVGARMCSDYGRFMAREFGRGLALAGVQVISGMARGVDGISQKAAIEADGKSFGILGCGVDICYPDENRDVYEKICLKGGLISEYHPKTEPRPNLFPMRNRIISGLADIVLVVEARQKSGTQITVDQALEQGKEVLAVPGRVTDRLSDGCNFLISQGAGVALGVRDVLDRLWKTDSYERKDNGSVMEKGREEAGEDVIEGERSSFGKDSQLSLEYEIEDVIDIIPISASTITEKLHAKGIDIPIPKLMSCLMEMTYKGRVIQDGVYYRKKLENIRK